MSAQLQAVAAPARVPVARAPEEVYRRTPEPSWTLNLAYRNIPGSPP